MFISPEDAKARKIKNGEIVRMFNDVSAIEIDAKVSSLVRPGQVIVYNGWEPYQFEHWKGAENVEPGMVKWLHLAGGYGHLQYRSIHWQPVPIDRAIHVDVGKVKPARKGKAKTPAKRSKARSRKTPARA